MNILADENLTAAESLLSPLGNLTLVPGRDIGPAMLEDIDALLVRSVTRVDADLLENSRVKFVGTATSGIDHVDVNYLEKQNIAFTFSAGANANSVVEYVLAAIAGCGDYLEQVLRGETVGIVGYGRIGSMLARRLEALGIRYKCYDPWLTRDSISRPCSLDEILACRVICLHAELTSQPPWPSFHLLSASELAALGKGQLLINACRGPVVDNSALLARLGQPNPPDVVLDVWEEEPTLDPELLESVRFGTAHIAGYSHNAKYNGTAMLAETLAAFWGCTLSETGSASNTQAIDAPAGEGVGFLRSLLIGSYDISLDDKLLREVVAGAAHSEVLARGFDRLRKEYRKRDELKGARVQIDPNREQACRVLEALGCEVQAAL